MSGPVAGAFTVELELDKKRTLALDFNCFAFLKRHGWDVFDKSTPIDLGVSGGPDRMLLLIAGGLQSDALLVHKEELSLAQVGALLSPERLGELKNLLDQMLSRDFPAPAKVKPGGKPKGPRKARRP